MQLAALIRIDLRRRRLPALALATLVGLGLCIPLVAAAGARRTQTAYPRFLAHANAPQLLVNPNNGTASKLDDTQVRQLPEVTAMGRIDGVAAAIERNGKVDESALASVTAIAADLGLQTAIDRPKILAGRLPSPTAADEIAVSDTFARQEHVGVRSTMAWQLFTPESVAAAEQGGPLAGQRVQLHVVGVYISSSEVLTDEADRNVSVVFSHAVLRTAFSPYFGLALRLRSEFDLAKVEAEVKALVPDETFVFQTASDQRDRVARVIAPETIALWAFAAVIALAVLVAASQMLVRHLGAARAEAVTLGTIGCTRREVFGMLMARAAAIAGAACGIAVVIAALASPLLPVGTARRAEFHPGLAVNVAVLGSGAALLLVLLLVGGVALPTWRLARRAAAKAEPTRPATASARLVRSLRRRPAAAIGVRNGLLSGAGEETIPTRSALAGATLAVAWMVAGIVFAASAAHFVDTPRLWGWHWDALITIAHDSSSGPAPSTEPNVVSALKANGFGPIAHGEETQITFGRHTVTAIALTSDSGRATATTASGRAPTGATEVALGSRTLRLLHTHVGSTVSATDRDGHTGVLHVVGEAVFPGLSAYPGADPTSLGSGALLSESGFQRFGQDLGSQIVTVGYGPHGSAAALRRIVQPWVSTANGGIETVSTQPLRPSDVDGLVETRSIPLALAALLAALALVGVGHVLVVTVRRRRAELAVLKTVGFVRRQLRAVVAWQAATVSGVAIAIGLPLGLALGRLAWALCAHQLGVPVEFRVGALALGAAASAVFCVSIALAELPARAAARLSVVDALRAD